MSFRPSPSSASSTRIASCCRGICRRATACSSPSATTMRTCRPFSSSTPPPTIVCLPGNSCCPASASRSSCSPFRTPPSSTPRSAIRIRSAAVSTGPSRGAWYAAFALETSQAEVGFHKSVQLAEIGRFEDTVTYDDYVADFSASFHDLRSRAAWHARVPRSGYLCRVSGAGRTSAGGGFARRDLSERPARGRHMRRLLQARARRECAGEGKHTASRGTAVPSPSLRWGGDRLH